MRIGIAAVILIVVLVAGANWANGLSQEFSNQVAQVSDQELRDKNGRLLGKVRLRSGGKWEGRDASGRLKGTYDPQRRETRDEHGTLVGKGNLLPVLIVNCPVT